MSGPAGPQHQCEYSARTAELEKQVQALQKQLDALKARHERRAEKMRAPREEAARNGERAPKGDGRKNREKGSRDDLPKETARTHVPPEKCICPDCKVEMPKVGETQDTIIERIPERVVHRTVVNEVRECRCGRRVTSEKPVRAFEHSEFGPGLVAHVVTAKVADSMPLYRQSNTLLRAGIRLHRNTLLDMFHGCAAALAPIWRRMVEVVAESALVQADETSIRVLAEEKCRTAFVWVFLNAQVIAYVFSASRSGATPRATLGKAEGEQVITTDAYSGYNKLEELDGWTRAGCLAHGRRKMFEALESAPAAVQGMDFIRWMYLVEHEAEDMGIKGTAEHLQMRRTRTLFIFRKFHRWLLDEKPRHAPQSRMGKAIRYALNQRRAWMPFFRDARIPLDNNASEAALRIVALLRKNALFVGNDGSGENHAVLLSLVATCRLHGINPEEYLRDVMLRVQEYDPSGIDALLPHNWKTRRETEQAA
jgi:transposase